MTARQADLNGFWEVKDNPISRVGVFPYLGRSIGAPEPDRVYQVYRPAEELSDPDALASFRLLPWVDDHTMLGGFPEAEMGVEYTDAAKKGVQGVIGENVWFDPQDGDGVVKANLKVFSAAHAAKINAGKKELSAGYRCIYDFTPGVFNGIPYDVVQRTLRGNHIASVKDGRMGPDVAVQDHMTFSMDGLEFIPVKTKKKGVALDAAELAQIAALDPDVVRTALAALDADEDKGDDTPPAKDADTETGDDTPPAKDADTETGDEGEGEEKTPPAKDADVDAPPAKDADMETKGEAKDAATGMDEATFVQRAARRDRMARDLKPVVGAFDHAEMTLDAVASYGVRKLKLTDVPKGSEELAVRMYLAGRSAVAGAKATATQDAKDTPKAPGFIARALAPAK